MRASNKTDPYSGEDGWSAFESAWKTSLTDGLVPLERMLGGKRPAHLAVVSCREELEGGEAVDFDRLNLVGCWVHLGDDDVSTVLVLLTQFLPDRGQLLAVSTPRGVWWQKSLESAWSEIRIGRSMQRKIGIKPTKIWASHTYATFTSCMHVSYDAI